VNCARLGGRRWFPQLVGASLAAAHAAGGRRRDRLDVAISSATRADFKGKVVSPTGHVLLGREPFVEPACELLAVTSGVRMKTWGRGFTSTLPMFAEGPSVNRDAIAKRCDSLLRGILLGLFT
jgi:hypothetical protein